MFNLQLAINPPVTEVCISDFPEDSTASLGENVVFHVYVYGEPTPNLTWLHNEKDVSSDCSVDIKEDGTLVIPTMEHHHAGTYRLNVSNGYSSACREVTLSVEEDEEEESPYSPLGIMNQPPVSNDKAVPLHSFEQFVARHHTNNNQPFQFQFMVSCPLVRSFTCSEEEATSCTYIFAVSECHRERGFGRNKPGK